MPRFFVLLPLLFLTLAAPSCTRTLSVSSANPVQPVYRQGVPVLQSQKKHIVAVGLLTDRFGNDLHNLPSVYVELRNRGKNTIDFSTLNLSATSGGRKVRIYTADDIERIVRTQAAIMAMATAMNAASQSLAASMPQTSYTYGSASAYGSGGYVHGTYTGYTTTYNPAASASAIASINANASNTMAGIAATRDANLDALTTMLQRNTVAPGQAAGGAVKMKAADLGRKKPLILTVSVEGESHEFKFEVDQNQ